MENDASKEPEVSKTPIVPRSSMASALLLTAAMVSAPLAVGGYYAKGCYDARQAIEEAEGRTKKDVEEVLKNEHREFKDLQSTDIVPEAKRTAEAILLSVPYVDQKRENWLAFFDAEFGPMLRAMPKYAKIHIATQDDLQTTAEQVATYYGRPGNITLYPSFNIYNTEGSYVQDIGEATGSLGPNGQFQIVTSREEIDSIQGAYKNLPIPVTENMEGLNFFALDMLLSKKFPGAFETKHVDSMFVGGNMTFGVMPNGETCVFVAPIDIVQYMFFVNKVDPRDPLDQSKYNEVKEKYAKAYGTKNIIVLDEENFLAKAKDGDLYQASEYKSPFFHADMVFTQHIIDGKPTMFVSSLREGADLVGNDINTVPQDCVHQLDRARDQFTKMGYNVVNIPVLIPDQNFVNVIPYTDKETHKPTVIMPYYHAENWLLTEDDEENPQNNSTQRYNNCLRIVHNGAKEKYEAAGVEVIAAAYVKDNSVSIKSHTTTIGSNAKTINQGGFHCRVQIMK